MLALCLSGALLFAGLGIWQVDRLAWKRDLIQRVQARIHAPPQPVPARAQWATLDPKDAEYRRVQARGVYLPGRDTLVDAVTALGPGAWVLTPLQTEDGVILVNRGFIAAAQRDAPPGAQDAPVQVTGLLRLPEPRGRILRSNEPDAGRWFSRDVAAIAQARGLEDVAPFFIDAEREDGKAADQHPIGGMTVVAFRNAHLTYAATWFALSALCGAGLILLRRTGP